MLLVVKVEDDNVISAYTTTDELHREVDYR